MNQPDYLRTIGLQKWTPDEGWSVDTLSNGDLPTEPLSTPGVAIPRRVTVTSLDYRDQFLPIYDGTSSIAGLGSGWFYDAALESVHRADPVKPDPYEISVSTVRRGADQLRADTVTAGGTLTETGTLADEVTTLTAQVTAGATTAFDKAEALRRWFTDPANGFTYSLDVPPGDSGDKLVDFLNNRTGILRAVRLGDGHHAACRGGTRQGGDRIHPGRAGPRRQLHDQQQRCARLG